MDHNRTGCDRLARQCNAPVTDCLARPRDQGADRHLARCPGNARSGAHPAPGAIRRHSLDQPVAVRAHRAAGADAHQAAVLAHQCAVVAQDVDQRHIAALERARAAEEHMPRRHAGAVEIEHMRHVIDKRAGDAGRHERAGFVRGQDHIAGTHRRDGPGGAASWRGPKGVTHQAPGQSGLIR